MWARLKEFAHFSKKQRNGLFVLLFCILTLQVALYYDEWFYAPETLDDETRLAFTAMLEQDSLARYKASVLPPAFAFDPNEANDSVLKVLGLSRELRKKMRNYVNKGGVFRSKKDVLRIYGMDSTWFAHVAPFIQLPDTQVYFGRGQKDKKLALKTFDPNQISKSELRAMGLKDGQAKGVIAYREKVKPFKTENQLYAVYSLDSSLVEEMLPYIHIDTSALPKEKKKTSPIADIALADSSALSRVWGISPFLARRIVKYRARLGGFVSIEQVREIYGVNDEKYRKIEPYLKLEHIDLMPLDLNKSDFKTLVRHPYLDYEMVKSIVYFREQTRPFKSIEELKHLEGMNDSLFKKTKPYLSVE